MCQLHRFSNCTGKTYFKKKGISVTEDEEGNPRIDVSELFRGYGDKVKMLEEGAGTLENKTPQDRTASTQ